jgi:gamma-glutamyltranspeptidase/glutathione hydrolase
VFFTHGGDTALKPGETFKQPRLVKALIALRDRKAKGFYSGPVAKDIVAAVRAAGGEMTGKDLANYKVRWLKPITTSYAGDKVYLMPPPSSGGVVILSALHMMEKLGLKKKAALSAEEFHLIGEVESRAFRGRALLGDPDFSKNPVSFLTSGSYLDELTKSISPNKVVALAPLKPGDLHEGSETTHYTIMDSDGHAVALTVTLNGIYGSGVVSPGFGIALNDEMDDFTTHPGEPNMFGLIQGDANDVAAGKRPLSSMSPTLVEHDGKVVLALGAPGGPRIITGVLQVLYRVVGRGQDLDLAVQAPRVHHQFLPNILYVDRERFSPEVLDTLKNYGHKVEESGMGKVYAVRLRPDAILEGAFDSRGEGAAGGY